MRSSDEGPEHAGGGGGGWLLAAGLGLLVLVALGLLGALDAGGAPAAPDPARLWATWTAK